MLRGATAFVSAFTLFVGQPMLAKWLLPAFGGSPATWAACMVFFQGTLLLGYAYAHALSRLRTGRRELGAHAALALAAAVAAWSSRSLLSVQAEGAAPALRIAWALARQVGVPYLLLSSTAPLLQRWAAGAGDRAPQRLYAVSNTGSLLALLCYPVLIEGASSVAQQYRWFRWSCMLVAAASVACAAMVLTGSSRRSRPVLERESPVPGRAAFYWAACAGVPCMFLLAVTNHITVDVAATPLLWIVPLALYLGSFIAAFAGLPRWLRTALLPAWIVVSLWLGYDAFAQGAASLPVQLGCSLAGLSLSGLLCHDALVRSRPAAAQLTSFYLWIAVGGVLGGVFVSWIAPRVLRDYYELELSCVLTYVVLLLRPSPRTRRVPRLRPSAARRLRWLGLGMCLPLMAASVGLRAFGEGRHGHVIERRRSFLGALRVTQFDFGRILTHGRIRHGMQLSAPDRRRWPTMYFGPGTALARVMRSAAPARGRRIGVVGLGVGTIAAYGRAGDVMRFYELDPNVVDIARRDFSFLRDSAARIEFALGDGRLLLAHEPPQGFDVLVLDAFASDSVPVHLLTREAFGVYVRALAPGGVLLANVSNRHLPIDRVVRASARAHGLSCEVVETAADPERFVSKVRWAVMAKRAARLRQLLSGLRPAPASAAAVLWTDAQASLWSLL